MKILAYQQALESIQEVVSQRKWDELEVKTEQLNRAKDDLQRDLQYSEMDDESKKRLAQLSIKHRRVMRQLSNQLHQTESDLNSVLEGLRHIHHVQAFHSSVYSLQA
ncbi:MAG: hypothetical protein Q9M18_06420 [Mariprofundaceae bacterium]|nr:hypothetical protein [Mariprofundaceae bacterium]